MSKSEIVEAIRALAEYIKANSDECGPMNIPSVEAARVKAAELISRL